MNLLSLKITCLFSQPFISGGINPLCKTCTLFCSVSLLISVSYTHAVARSYYKMLESRQETLTKGIRPRLWKLLLYTSDGSTVGKRIWLAAQVTDKWACESDHPMQLESENISVPAGVTMCVYKL